MKVREMELEERKEDESSTWRQTVSIRTFKDESTPQPPTPQNSHIQTPMPATEIKDARREFETLLSFEGKEGERERGAHPPSLTVLLPCVLLRLLLHIEFDALLRDTPSDKLIVVDFHAVWW